MSRSALFGRLRESLRLRSTDFEFGSRLAVLTYVPAELETLNFPTDTLLAPEEVHVLVLHGAGAGRGRQLNNHLVLSRWAVSALAEDGVLVLGEAHQKIDAWSLRPYDSAIHGVSDAFLEVAADMAMAYRTAARTRLQIQELRHSQPRSGCRSRAADQDAAALARAELETAQLRWRQLVPADLPALPALLVGVQLEHLDQLVQDADFQLYAWQLLLRAGQTTQDDGDVITAEYLRELAVRHHGDMQACWQSLVHRYSSHVVVDALQYVPQGDNQVFLPTSIVPRALRGEAWLDLQACLGCQIDNTSGYRRGEPLFFERVYRSRLMVWNAGQRLAGLNFCRGSVTADFRPQRLRLAPNTERVETAPSAEGPDRAG